MKNYLWIAVLLKTFHKTLIPETQTPIHTHLVLSFSGKILQLTAWKATASACHIHESICQSWFCSAQQMNLPGMTARAATHSIIMGSLLSGLKDTHYTPPLPPPRENKNTPYPTPQSTCCQLQKWKWYQVSLVISCNPPKPLYKLPREKFTIAVNLAWAQAQPPAPGQLAVHPFLPLPRSWGVQHNRQRGVCMLCLKGNKAPKTNKCPQRGQGEAASRKRWWGAWGSSWLPSTMDALVFCFFPGKTNFVCSWTKQPRQKLSLLPILNWNILHSIFLTAPLCEGDGVTPHSSANHFCPHGTSSSNSKGWCFTTASQNQLGWKRHQRSTSPVDAEKL